MGSPGNDFTDLVLGSSSSCFNVYTIAPSFLDVVCFLFMLSHMLSKLTSKQCVVAQCGRKEATEFNNKRSPNCQKQSEAILLLGSFPPSLAVACHCLLIYICIYISACICLLIVYNIIYLLNTYITVWTFSLVRSYR